jgi:gamma-glutamyltranspeptidase/glutathione hydrolase
VLGRTWGAPRTALRLEPRFDERLLEALAAAGHDIDLLSEPRSDVMGHAGAVVLHPNGTCEGGHDPRADGGAAGA